MQRSERRLPDESRDGQILVSGLTVAVQESAPGKAKLRDLIENLLPFLSLIILFIALCLLSPYFFTVKNLSSVARQTAVINIIALGMTLIMVSGGIDLSVGAMLAFCGIIGTMCLQAGLPVVVSILIAVLVGMGWGAINGLITTKLKITPFIATLGTLGVIRGLTLIISNGMPVVNVPKSFGYLGDGTLLGVIPVPVLLLVALALLVHYILKYTRLGRYAYAIGSNMDAARYAGINIGGYMVAIYALAGAMTGLAGMIESSRLMTGQPTAGEGYELKVIAAVVIGGGSLKGGEGTVLGTIIGAFIMSLLSNGSNLLGISPFFQQVLIGSVIILAVALDEYRRRRLL